MNSEVTSGNNSPEKRDKKISILSSNKHSSHKNTVNTPCQVQAASQLKPEHAMGATESYHGQSKTAILAKVMLLKKDEEQEQESLTLQYHSDMQIQARASFHATPGHPFLVKSARIMKHYSFRCQRCRNSCFTFFSCTGRSKWSSTSLIFINFNFRRVSPGTFHEKNLKIKAHKMREKHTWERLRHDALFYKLGGLINRGFIKWETMTYSASCL